MTLVKKETINAKKFEKKMIGLIKMAEGMDMPENTKKILLDELRRVHNGCLEWGEPSKDFEIVGGMEI